MRVTVCDHIPCYICFIFRRCSGLLRIYIGTCSGYVPVACGPSVQGISLYLEIVLQSERVLSNCSNSHSSFTTIVMVIKS